MSRAAAPGKVEAASLVRTPAADDGFAVLEQVGRRLSTGLGEYLAGFAGTPAAVTVAPVQTIDRDRWADETGECQLSRTLRLLPADSPMMARAPLRAIRGWVDRHFGGEGDTSDGRDVPSRAELRMMERLAATLCNLLAAAWQPYDTVTAELVEDLSPPDPFTAIIQRFSIRCDGWPALELACLYPIDLLERIQQSAAPSRRASVIAGRGWSERLAASVLAVEFPVCAILAELQLPLSRLVGLRPGDILPACLPAPIRLTVAGKSFAGASAGESSGRAAVQIDRI